MASVARQQHNKAKPIKKAKDDKVAVSSAGLYKNHLYFDPDTQPYQNIIIQFYRPYALPDIKSTILKHWR